MIIVTELQLLLNKEKNLIDAVAYIMNLNGGTINYTCLIKMLYIADKESLNRYDYPITKDDHYSMPYGPVLSGLLDYVNSNKESNLQKNWDIFFERSGNKLILKKSGLTNTHLSRASRSIIDEVFNEHKDKDYGELIDYVHTKEIFPEWDNPGSTSSRLPKNKILISIGRSSNEANIIVAGLDSLEENGDYLLRNFG